MGARLRVGTCGWQYADWRDAFYPPGVPQRAWLATYAGSFDTVECDNAFYRLPKRETFEKWAGELPDGFTMAVKASRFLTHIKRLREPEEPVTRLMQACAGLGDRLGPILLQLPPTFKADADRLDACLARFPSSARVAVEPRHETWFTDEIRGLLSRRGAALVWADRLGQPVAPLWRTAAWGYVRLHEGRAGFPPRYPASVLRRWLKKIDATWPEGDEGPPEVFVYLNNDPGAAAPRDAAAMARLRAHPASARSW